MTQILNCCKKCNGEAESFTRYETPQYKQKYGKDIITFGVQCKKCREGWLSKYQNSEDAIEAWNNRNFSEQPK